MSKTGYFSNTFTIINNAILKNEKLRKIKSIYYYIDSILLKLVKKPKMTTNAKKKIAISYNMSLGDGAIFMCALKNLRKIYPEDEYEITLFCQKGLNKMYEKIGIFDEIIPLNFTGSTVNLKERINTFKALRKDYYDIALDPIGIEECTMNVLMNRAICAKEKIGIINNAKKLYCPKNIKDKVYTKIININKKNISYIEQYFEFFNQVTDKKFPIEFRELPEEQIKENLPEKYFIINPSASTEYKKWPLERFVEIAKRMYKVLNIPLVLCGTGVDQKTNNEFKEKMGNNIEIIDMTNKTNILQYIGLIKKAHCIITNDTGTYHVATISQVPTLILAGGYTYDKYIAYDFKGNEKFRKPYIVTEKMECFNCENRCTYKDKIENVWPCLEKITIEAAWKKAQEMIRSEEL